MPPSLWYFVISNQNWDSRLEKHTEQSDSCQKYIDLYIHPVVKYLLSIY